MMNSRAISPLIAMVLLVSLTVSTAGLVLVFGTHQTEVITDFAEEQIEASETFLEAQLSLEDSSFPDLSEEINKDGERVNIILSNPSDETLNVDSVFIVGDAGKEQVPITPITLAPGGIKTTSFTDTYEGTVQWFEIVPKNLEGKLAPALKFTPAGFKQRNELYTAARLNNVVVFSGGSVSKALSG